MLLFNNLWRYGIELCLYLSVFAWLILNFWMSLLSMMWSLHSNGNISFNSMTQCYKGHVLCPRLMLFFVLCPHPWHQRCSVTSQPSAVLRLSECQGVKCLHLSRCQCQYLGQLTPCISREQPPPARHLLHVRGGAAAAAAGQLPHPARDQGHQPRWPSCYRCCSLF